MYVPHKKGYEQQLRYYRALREYEENCRIGQGTYREFAKCVGMNLNLVMASAKGYHRDHIVPKSFCRKLGISVSQTNHPKNLRYLKPKDNVDKFSFMYSEELAHLKVMCEIWGVSFPSRAMIDEHNASAATKSKALLGNKKEK